QSLQPQNSPKIQKHSFPPYFHCILTQTVTNIKRTKFQLIPIQITALGGGVTVRFSAVGPKRQNKIQPKYYFILGFTFFASSTFQQVSASVPKEKAGNKCKRTSFSS
ncbi:hypothetical protein, partial [Thiolapillus sp.]|uniref:hypothetical protein n=1 Tax=Thiolapillus sp. TaxID=2017437 RepID=UPI003AF749D1